MQRATEISAAVVTVGVVRTEIAAVALGVAAAGAVEVVRTTKCKH